MINHLAETWTPEAASVEATSTFDAITTEVRKRILQVLTDPDCKGAARNRRIAELVVDALGKVGKLTSPDPRNQGGPLRV